MKKILFGVLFIGVFGSGLFAGAAAINKIYNDGWVYDRVSSYKEDKLIKGTIWVVVVHKKNQFYDLLYYGHDGTTVTLEDGSSSNGMYDPIGTRSLSNGWYLSYYKFTSWDSEEINIEIGNSWKDEVITFKN